MLKVTENFLKTTEQRIPEEIIRIFSSEDFKFDIHTHIFNKDYIPDKYFSIRMPYLVDSEFLLYMGDLLKQVESEGDDKLYNYAYFIDFVTNNSMLDIAEFLIDNSPQNTIFCPLMMDFKYGISEKTKKDVFDYLEEMKTIREKYPSKFLPFVAIDPNNPRHFELFEKAFSKEYNYFGVKIYPSLGYLPSHPALMQIFEICAKYNIPVTTHCGSGNVHIQKNNLNLPNFVVQENGKLKLRRDKKTFFFKKQYETFFNNPKNWEPVLRAFPNLRLNLSHFGGEKEWDSKYFTHKTNLYSTIDLMERYKNVYTDVSYIFHNEKMSQEFLKIYENNEILRERILYGSDFPMIFIEGSYKELRSHFTTEIGTKIMQQISVKNPLDFLNLTEIINTEKKQ